jgi:hypothetical protein
MKPINRIMQLLFLVAVSFFMLFAFACNNDDPEDPDTQDIFWNPNWLIGTWEATTQSNGDPMFDNKKIRIVFDSVALKVCDTVPNNIVKTWYYSGNLTWDVDGTAPWNMKFFHKEYPTGVNSIGWQSASLLQADVTVNNISLRIGDSVNMQPSPEYDFDLDWGPYNDYSREPLTTLDFYGDIQIYMNGMYYEADYLPEVGKMLRFTKK